MTDDVITVLLKQQNDDVLIIFIFIKNIDSMTSC